MKTDDLVAMLAANTEAIEPQTARRWATALAWGTGGAVLVLLTTLGLRADLRQAMLLPMFWVKLAFPLFVAVAAWSAVTRLARPGMTLGRAPIAGALPLVVVWLLAIVELLRAAPDTRVQLVFGQTWSICPILIAMVSAPVFAASLWAMKGLAPTRLALAGGASGLLAGAAGAAVYALHCPEMDAPFLAIWYVTGMLIPAAIGGLAGPRLLRW